MGKKQQHEDIRVWRHDDLGSAEFRMGTAVSEPYPKHWHDEYQFCLITEGGGELNYRGARHDTPSASLFVVHPGEVHSNNTRAGCSFRSAYFEPELLRGFISNGENSVLGFPFFREPMIFDGKVVASFLTMHTLVETCASTLEREASLHDFLRMLTERSRFGNEVPRSGSEPKVVKLVREYIVEHYERNISLRELTTITGLSPFYLSRVFSDSVGMPPHAFQTQVRVSAGKRLIRCGKTVADTAAAVGFADQSHFHRHFRRLMKVTPGEYEKNSKNVQF